MPEHLPRSTAHLPYNSRGTRAPTEKDASPSYHAPDGSASTLLDAPEINVERVQEDTPWGSRVFSDDPPVCFRHRCWEAERRRVMEALKLAGTPPRRFNRFALCGCEPWVIVSDETPRRVRVSTNTCKSRWCKPCAADRSARIVANLTAALNGKDVRLLTLTLRHRTERLKPQVNRLIRCFRGLRQQPFWKNATSGGAYFVEVKRSPIDALWHVHLHAVLIGKYMAHADLKASWWRITGDSNIVDIRLCRDHDKVAAYVAKYISKPIPFSVRHDPEGIIEMMRAFVHQRLVSTFGCLRGVKLSAPLDDAKWKLLAPLDQIVHRAYQGDLDAICLLNELRAGGCHWPEVLGIADDLPDG